MRESHVKHVFFRMAVCSLTRAILAWQCVVWLVQCAKMCDTNHIPWATAYSGPTLQNLYNQLFRRQSSSWIQVPVPAGHLAIKPEGCWRIQSKILTAKAMAELLGQCSGTAWADWTGKHHCCTNSGRFQVGSSLFWPQQARWRKKVLPLLLYWFSSRLVASQRFQRYINFKLWWRIFFLCEMKFLMNWQELDTY